MNEDGKFWLSLFYVQYVYNVSMTRETVMEQ